MAKGLKNGCLTVVCAVVTGLTTAGADWDCLNERASRLAAEPVRAGVPGLVPFWNARSRAFIHPPAFDFKPIHGARSYRFSVTEKETGRVRTFIADRPSAPLSPVWGDIPPCYVHVCVEGLGAGGKVLGVAGKRDCYRAAVFRGPYPKPKNRDYGAAAKRCYAAIFRLGHVQAWLKQGKPSRNYDLYCYPSKLVSSIVIALLRHSELEPSDAEKAVAIACKMADWLISVSQPAGMPLEYLPPTYWGDSRQEAVNYAGQNMLLYPACAAGAYFRLFDKTKNARYCEAGFRILRTMDRLRLGNGTWWIKVFEKDGKPVCKNLLVPYRQMFEMYDQAAKLPGGEKYASYRLELEKYIYKTAFKTWNWEGQFEDGELRRPYHNLQKGTACEFASWLFSQGRLPEAEVLLAWGEDQFIVWSNPIHHMDWKNWKMPTALEQYDYYTPIDASMADFIGSFTSAWQATGDELYLEKARALADCVLRHQRADGTIPTYFDSRPGNDWVNCMVYTASALERLDRAVKGRFESDGEDGFVPLFNGKDLDGWEGATDTYGVTSDGCLTCLQRNGIGESGSLNLWTVRDYTNFVIRFDVKFPPNANNGLGIRTQPNGWCSREGIEMQLLDDWGDAYNGSNALANVHYTGSIYGIVGPARRVNGESYLNKPGVWNSIEVTADGPRIVFKLNGTVVLDSDVSKFSTDGTIPPDGIKRPGLHNKYGRIHWCGHGHGIYWRNIRIRELP